MAMTSTSKRIGFAGERMVEVEERAAVVSSRRKPAKSPAPSGELNSISELTLSSISGGRALRAIRSTRRGLWAPKASVAASSKTWRSPAASPSRQFFERFGELAAAHLQGRRRQAEGADVLGAVEVGEAVVQRQIAVGPTHRFRRGGYAGDGWGSWLPLLVAGGGAAVSVVAQVLCRARVGAAGRWRPANWSQAISTRRC
jgi:hypothetical protein